MQALARTRVGGWLFVTVFPVIDRRLIPLTRGCLKVAMGQPILLLHTCGARSGQPRTTPLLYTRHGDGFVVAASKAGTEHHPAWYHNIRAHPDEVDIEIAGQRIPVHAHLVEGLNGRSFGSALMTIRAAMKPTRGVPAVASSGSCYSSGR